MFSSAANYARQVGFSSDLALFKSIQNKNLECSFAEIAFVSATAVLLAVFISATEKRKLLNKAARMLRVSKQTGELDIWGFSLNSEYADYVTIRDHENDLVYDGWVSPFATAPDLGGAASIILAASESS